MSLTLPELMALMEEFRRGPGYTNLPDYEDIDLVDDPQLAAFGRDYEEPRYER